MVVWPSHARQTPSSLSAQVVRGLAVLVVDQDLALDLLDDQIARPRQRLDLPSHRAIRARLRDLLRIKPTFAPPRVEGRPFGATICDCEVIMQAGLEASSSGSLCGMDVLPDDPAARRDWLERWAAEQRALTRAGLSRARLARMRVRRRLAFARARLPQRVALGSARFLDRVLDEGSTPRAMPLSLSTTIPIACITRHRPGMCCPERSATSGCPIATPSSTSDAGRVGSSIRPQDGPSAESSVSRSPPVWPRLLAPL